MATDHEASHSRNITWTLRAKQAPEYICEPWIGTSWIVEVEATGSRDGKLFQVTHLFLTSLRTTPDALRIRSWLRTIYSYSLAKAEATADGSSGGCNVSTPA